MSARQKGEPARAGIHAVNQRMLARITSNNRHNKFATRINGNTFALVLGRRLIHKSKFPALLIDAVNIDSRLLVKILI